MHKPSTRQASRRQVLALSMAAAGALAVPRAARAAHLVRAWPEGKAAPLLALTDLDGKSWSLAALRGQPVMLNFWASWCEPCRSEMPSLELVATRHERAGLVVLAVNYQEAAPVIKRFLDVMPFSLPILLDRDGAATAAWTPRVFPTTVLIDRDGTPRHSVLGDLDWMGPEARELIDPLVRQKPHTA
ncbi:MAG: TlpA disulfide reductase family protein [Burkholderiaceae bacterium]